jgi:hypothetical protein
MGLIAFILMIIPSKYINIDEVMVLRDRYNRERMQEIPEIGGTGQTNLNSPYSAMEYR